MQRGADTSEDAKLRREFKDVYSWASRDLVEDTLRVWQPRYDYSLTERDALQILRNVGRVIDILEDQ